MIYQVKLTFTEPLLGGAPLSAKVYTDFLASRRGEETPDNPLTDGELNEELASLPDGNKGVTGFHRDADGNPIVYDYVVKGYTKEACSNLARLGDSYSKALKAHRKVIDGLLHVYPRQIPLVLAGPIYTMTRPLRAQTMQGERITLATSEAAPAGSTLDFEIYTLSDSSLPSALICEWLGYGQFKGLGQWRNASWGRFTVQVRAASKSRYMPAPVELVAA